MTPKLYRAAEVCDIAQVQPYVLRSWEKEFPGIGVQKSADSPRIYRQSDLDQVLLIKRLVFNEGLTLSGARRKLEETALRTPAEADHDVAEVLDALASDARTRIAYVRDGLRSVLRLLSSAPGTLVVVDDAAIERDAPRASKPASPPILARPKTKTPAKAASARPGKAFGAKPATMKSPAAKASGKAKRSRASA